LVDGIPTVFVTRQRQMEDGRDGDWVVKALAGAGRGAAACNPVLKVAYLDGNTGEARKRGGTRETRPSNENIGARTANKPPVEAPKQKQRVFCTKTLFPTHEGGPATQRN
jgi:hypothetical protein